MFARLKKAIGAIAATIKTVFTNRNTWTAIALFGVFAMLTVTVPFRLLIEVLNWISFAVAVAVTVSYFPYAWRFFMGRRLDNIMQLTLGITTSWLSFFSIRGWVIAWRGVGRPDWMEQSVFIAAPIFLAIIAGSLHLTAPGAVAGIVPKKNWIVLGVTVGIGAALAGASVAFGFVDF